MNSAESLTTLGQGEIFFLVTNYWETASGNIGFSQGKNVTEVATNICGSHVDFSSLPR
jgi:hypothetical protein